MNVYININNFFFFLQLRFYQKIECSKVKYYILYLKMHDLQQESSLFLVNYFSTFAIKQVVLYGILPVISSLPARIWFVFVSVIHMHVCK